MNNKILSIQSKLIYGYVGSNIAELAIQLHGLDVISFPTVLLSTHTGHKPIYGRAISKELFDELVVGIENINIIKDVACVISGYIGSEEVLLSTSQFIQRIKKQFPDKLYICDPVMGDVDEGLYVPETVSRNLIESLIPHSDILTPNHFELEYLLGQEAKTVEAIKTLIATNTLLNNKIVVATSCNLKDTPEGVIETIIIDKGNVERIHSKRISIDTTGTGDLFAAMLSSCLSKGEPIVEAVTHASQTISKVLDEMTDLGLFEMNAACILKYVNRV